MKKVFHSLVLVVMGTFPAVGQNLPEQLVDVYATVDQAVGNIAFTANGGLVYSHHPFFKSRYWVVSYNPDNKSVSPFPNLAWNRTRTSDDHYLSNSSQLPRGWLINKHFD